MLVLPDFGGVHRCSVVAHPPTLTAFSKGICSDYGAEGDMKACALLATSLMQMGSRIRGLLLDDGSALDVSALVQVATADLSLLVLHYPFLCASILLWVFRFCKREAIHLLPSIPFERVPVVLQGGVAIFSSVDAREVKES